MGRIAEYVKHGLGRVIERAGLSLVPGTAVNTWMYGSGVALPHEPFAGAWQRNMDSAASAGPNIIGFPAVYACVSIIAQDTSRIPVLVLRDKEGGGKEEFKNHYAWRLFRNPNEYQTMLQFIENYMQSKLIFGNVYVLLLRDARGVVNRMYVLNPRLVRPLIAEDGSVFYEINRDQLNGIQEPLIVPGRNIVHDRINTMFHSLVGVSPLFAAGTSAMTGARIMINSEKFFANMSRAGGALISPGKIDPKVAKQLQTEWEQNYGPRGLGKTAVLANGLDFKSFTINAADSELVNQLRYVVEDVARVYRVPGFMLGDLNKVNFRNSETLAREYLTKCLNYHLEAFEQCFHKALEMPENVYIDFDESVFLRMETDTRYAAYQVALNAGWLSINEVRQKEDLPPVKGGEEPRVQMQYVPLSMANGLLTAPKPAGAPPMPAEPPMPAKPDDVDEPDEPTKSFTRLDLDALSYQVSKNIWGSEDGDGSL